MPGHHGGNAASTLIPWLILAAVYAAYLTATARQRLGRRRWSGWRTASFSAGILLLAAAFSPPLVQLAQYDLRGHMIQHLLVGMFAPLGLVLAAPLTLALRMLPQPASRRAAGFLQSQGLRWLAHPVTGLTLNIGGMVLLYLTPLYALSLNSLLIHNLVTIHFLAAGCLFTWAVASPDRLPHLPGMRTRLVILFVSIAAHSTLAKYMYAYVYPRGVTNDVDQIRLAAEIMYYGGDLAELLLAAALFAIWYAAPGRRPGQYKQQSGSPG